MECMRLNAKHSCSEQEISHTQPCLKGQWINSSHQRKASVDTELCTSCKQRNQLHHFQARISGVEGSFRHGQRSRKDASEAAAADSTWTI